MARRRLRTSATGGNMDSMLDTLTNVVGILLIVLVTVQLSTQEAADRIAEAMQKIDPAEVARIEQAATDAKAGADRAQQALDRLQASEKRDPAAEVERLAAEAAKAEQAAKEASARAAAIEKQKAEQSQAAKKAAEAAAQKAAETKAKAEAELQRAEAARQALAAELEKTEKPIVPPAKEVRLPDPRPAPPNAKEIPVLCREGRLWVVDPQEIREKVLKRADPIVARKKLDPDGDRWLPDGKVLAEEFNKEVMRAGDFKLTLVPMGTDFQIVLTRLPGSGQPVETAIKTNGDLTAALRRVNAADHYLRFLVWPDSFEGYLMARAHVGEKGFAAGWDPQGSPDEYRMGFYRIRIGTKPPESKDPPKPPQNVID